MPEPRHFGDTAKQITVPGFRQEIGQWQPIVGHRVLLRSGVGASQLHPNRQSRWPTKPYSQVKTRIYTTYADSTLTP